MITIDHTLESRTRVPLWVGRSDPRGTQGREIQIPLKSDPPDPRFSKPNTSPLDPTWPRFFPFQNLIPASTLSAPKERAKFWGSISYVLLPTTLCKYV